jgi:surface antigen
VQSLASKFGISENSIRWSNDLTSDSLRTGTKLYIPGTSGIVYVVKRGDSPRSLANTYRSNANRIITYNDAELSGLKPGQRIVIPGGVQRSTPSPSPSSGSAFNAYYASGFSSAAGNTYAYGYCTYWAFQRRAEIGRPIGNFWGDAITWRGFAIASGYTVNNTPAPGAVLYDPTAALPWGHVGFVEKVFSNGTVEVSDMNYRGWNVVSTRTLSAGQARSYSYIH